MSDVTARRDRGTARATRMREKLADALWATLESKRLEEVSVGDVIEAAGVSRGTFYYHFAEKDELVRWALRREILDADRRGTSLAALASRSVPCEGDPVVERSVERLCLLIHRGGMGVVYDAMLDVALELWTRLLQPADGRLPDEVVTAVEYGVGGMVGLLRRSGTASNDRRRVSVAFLSEQYARLSERVRSEARMVRA